MVRPPPTGAGSTERVNGDGYKDGGNRRETEGKKVGSGGKERTPVSEGGPGVGRRRG